MEEAKLSTKIRDNYRRKVHTLCLLFGGYNNDRLSLARRYCYEGLDYIAVKGKDDSIICIKKQSNIFDKAASRGENIDTGLGFPDGLSVGKELL